MQDLRKQLYKANALATELTGHLLMWAFISHYKGGVARVIHVCECKPPLLAHQDYKCKTTLQIHKTKHRGK